MLEARKEPKSPTPIEVTIQKKRKRGATKVGDEDKAIALKRLRVDGVQQTSQGNDGSLPFLADDVVKPLSDQKREKFLLTMRCLR